MAKKYPVTVKRKNKLDASVIEENTFLLNGKENLLYQALVEAKGEVISIPKLMTDLEFTKTYLRVTKLNLERILDGWVTIETLYGNGYFLRTLN